MKIYRQFKENSGLSKKELITKKEWKDSKEQLNSIPKTPIGN
jgi:hypothetical protein